MKPLKKAHTIATLPTATQALTDAFDTADTSDAEDGPEVPRTSIELDILPIELITLTDRCARSNLHSTCQWR